MIYFLLLDRKERYPSHEDQNLPPRNEIGKTLGPGRTQCVHVSRVSTYLYMRVNISIHPPTVSQNFRQKIKRFQSETCKEPAV